MSWVFLTDRFAHKLKKPVRYEFLDLSIEAGARRQAVVGWRAALRDRESDSQQTAVGHVQIRWSHGKFGQVPEAKVYLDTPYDQVPGYFALDTEP